MQLVGGHVLQHKCGRKGAVAASTTAAPTTSSGIVTAHPAAASVPPTPRSPLGPTKRASSASGTPPQWGATSIAPERPAARTATDTTGESPSVGGDTHGRRRRWGRWRRR